MCLIQWAVSLALTRKGILPKRARFVSCRQSQATDWSVVLAGGRTRTAGLLLREAGQPLALDVTRRRPRRRRRHQHTQARAAAPSPGLRGRAPPERRQAPRTPGGPGQRGGAGVREHKPNAKQERGKVVTKGGSRSRPPPLPATALVPLHASSGPWLSSWARPALSLCHVLYISVCSQTKLANTETRLHGWLGAAWAGGERRGGAGAPGRHGGRVLRALRRAAARRGA